MHEFLIIFEYIDDSVFKTINQLKNHLTIACKGRYELHVAFNTRENGLAKMYQLMGAPALIDLKTNQVVYGNFFGKEIIKSVASR